MDKLHIASLNVKGLRTSKSKRQKIFKWLKTCLKTDIVFLQETHSSEPDERIWSEEWGGDIYYAHGDTNARGVCILLKSTLDFQIHQITRSPLGRYIIIDLTVNDRRLTLVNVYGPNTDDPDFILEVVHCLDTYGNDDRIIGGDFNCILNAKMDKKGGAEIHANRKMSEILNALIEQDDLVDIWRKQHEQEKQFTYHCKQGAQDIFTRLDYFLTSFGISNLVQFSGIQPSILTDHSLITITIQLDDETRGNGYWKLNCSLLKDLEYITMVKETIHNLVNNGTNLTDAALWEFIKITIRGRVYSLVHGKSVVKTIYCKYCKDG